MQAAIKIEHAVAEVMEAKRTLAKATPYHLLREWAAATGVCERTFKAMVTAWSPPHRDSAARRRARQYLVSVGEAWRLDCWAP